MLHFQGLKKFFRHEREKTYLNSVETVFRVAFRRFSSCFEKGFQCVKQILSSDRIFRLPNNLSRIFFACLGLIDAKLLEVFDQREDVLAVKFKSAAPAGIVIGEQVAGGNIIRDAGDAGLVKGIGDARDVMVDGIARESIVFVLAQLNVRLERTEAEAYAAVVYEQDADLVFQEFQHVFAEQSVKIK